MAHILIAYATREGHTRKIVDVLATEARALGHDVDTLDVGQDTDEAPQPVHADAFIVGGSIHVGHHDKALVDFVNRHHDLLEARPSAFYSVSLSAASERPEGREAATQLMREFLEQTDWHPRLFDTIAGALMYSQYGLVKRFIMKMIARREGGGTDTTRDYEYTDWDAVRGFAREFVTSLSLASPAHTV